MLITQKISEVPSRWKKVCGIFFEILKAFDKIWHAGLITKLINYGFPHYLIRFIKNFLSDRSFKVNANEQLSGTKRREWGVPQGSILWPILFLVFINGIPCPISWVEFQVIPCCLRMTWHQFLFLIKRT
jgi:hypothetical protein